MSRRAQDRWAGALERWALPDYVLAGAPESPWGFDADAFARRARTSIRDPSPARTVASAVLPDDGSVLDIGCGGGAASLPLVPPAARVTGVDEQDTMLAVFAQMAEAVGAEHDQVAGRWPDVADRAPSADVVVCHDVLYNVADLTPFVVALTAHARRRVVVVLPEQHPMTWLSPYWQRLHGIERPTGPGADDAVAVIAATGAEPHVSRYQEATRWGREEPRDAVSLVRQRLCLPAEYDPRIADLLVTMPPPSTREVAVVWWEGGALDAVRTDQWRGVTTSSMSPLEP